MSNTLVRRNVTQNPDFGCRTTGRDTLIYMCKRVNEFVETRGAGVAFALALAALIWAIGVRRYAGTTSFFDLQFLMGPTVQALVERGTSCALLQLHNFQLHDVQQSSLEFCAHRRLLVPALLALASIAGLSVAVFAAMKAVVASAALVCSLRIVAAGLTGRWRLAPYAAFVLIVANPWFLSQMVALEVEEAYAIPLFAIVTALLVRPVFLGSHRVLAATALALFAIVMLKSSYVAVAIVLAGALAHSAPFPRRALKWLAPAVLAGLASVALSNAVTSGRFVTGSSIDWWNAYKGNNALTSQFYSESKLDQLPLHLPPSTHFADEWEFNRFFRAETVSFFKREPKVVVALAAERLWNYFLRVDFVVSAAPGVQAGGGILSWRWWFLANVPARLLFLGALVSALWWWKSQRLARLWPLVIVASAAPHALGFAYFRHVTPLLVPSALVLVSLVAASNARSKHLA